MIMLNNNSNPLTKETIDLIFEQVGCNDNEIVSALIRLYEWVVPDFGKSRKLHGFPRISNDTAYYILTKMQLMSGDYSSANMLWLNNGFSCREMPDWIADVSDVAVEY